jgi:hypothetical protein
MQGLAHMEFLSPAQPPRPIPISATGYRSHFCTPEAVAQLGTPQAYAATYCKVDFQQQLDSYQNISIIGQLLAQVQRDAAQTARRGSTLARILAAASGPPHGGLRVACGLSEPSELAAMPRPAMIITGHQYPFD